MRLLKGDNLELLKTLEDNSVDSIVTDPPYGLSFMNKKWDYDVPSVELWREVLRVLKPGGHVLSFGGTRTYHRMVVNMEDAGFEIRDQIMWLYGSGFPKSHNIGKAIQKQSGDVKVVGKKTGMGTTGNSYVSSNEEYIGGDKGVYKKEYDDIEINNEWEGWGTALKPANEPICLARKPLSEKSIAENVLKHGTGGINIDDSRIPFDMTDTNPATNPLYRQENEYKMPEKGQESNGAVSFTSSKNEISQEGRFPANVILDEEAGKILNEQSGISSSQKRTNFKKDNTIWQENTGETNTMTGGFNDKGGASRFFYTAKTSKKERNMGLEEFDEKESVLPGRNTFDENGNRLRVDGSVIPPLVSKNHHPTVKPVQLMSYLVKLITPPNGVVMDMYMGSGSTGIAALLNGFDFIGMEMDEDYFNIAEARINNYEEYRQFLKK